MGKWGLPMGKPNKWKKRKKHKESKQEKQPILLALLCYRKNTSFTIVTFRGYGGSQVLQQRKKVPGKGEILTAKEKCLRI